MASEGIYAKSIRGRYKCESCGGIIFDRGLVTKATVMYKCRRCGYIVYENKENAPKKD